MYDATLIREKQRDEGENARDKESSRAEPEADAVVAIDGIDKALEVTQEHRRQLLLQRRVSFTRIAPAPIPKNELSQGHS